MNLRVNLSNYIKYQDLAMNIALFIPCSAERMKLEKIARHNEMSKIIQTESFS